MYCRTFENLSATKKHRVIDLRSDTLVRKLGMFDVPAYHNSLLVKAVPTALMRSKMMEAEIGDDVYGEDPSVNELEARVAKMFGKDSALFVPSGTMANLLASK